METSVVQYNNDTKIADSKDINIYLAQEYINTQDPIPAIYFPRCEYPLTFYQTRDTLADMDRYKAFIDNCTHRFRKSRTYKSYKSYLMSMGLDRCQVIGNIQDGMANIEMHHNFLTIYDITILISQHILNTVGRCTTFDIVALLMQEHRNNNIPIVMLSETVHQLYHDNPDFYIPISMTFGKWWDLLIKYRYGITLDIAYKVVKYIQNCQRNNELNSVEFFKLSDDIKNWGEYNEYNYYNNYCGNIVNYGYGNNSNSKFEFNTPVENSSPDLRNSAGVGQILTANEIYG
jgi:hypothetical protein